jgi:hypothetical protein
MFAMASPHRCNRLSIASGISSIRCGRQARSPESRGYKAASPSGIGEKADDKDHSKPDCCAIDSTSKTCWQCHTWLYKNRFEEHMAIATGNIQDGSLLHTSQTRKLMHCTTRGCQLCHTILASIRSQVKVALPDQEPLSGLTRYSLYLLPDVPGWTIKVVFETALEDLHTDIRLVPGDRIKSEDILDTPRWTLDLTSVDDGKSRICFQQPHEGCAYRLDTKRIAAQIKTWIENCKSLDQRCCGQNKGYNKQGHLFRLLFLGDEHAPCPRLVDAIILTGRF